MLYRRCSVWTLFAAAAFAGLARAQVAKPDFFVWQYTAPNEPTPAYTPVTDCNAPDLKRFTLIDLYDGWHG